MDYSNFENGEAKEIKSDTKETETMEPKIESQVFSYNAPWTIYALGFSTRPNSLYRIGIGSFLEEKENKIEIVQLNESTQIFEKYMSFEHKYPPTKLMFIPDLKGNFSDILATSGESLKIWQLYDEPEKRTELKSDLKNRR